MKKVVHLILMFIFIVEGLTTLAQNLVPNPSFEDTVACPTADNQLNYTVGWEKFGSPEYFNICSSSLIASVPNNWGGYQQPANGSAYVAIGTYGDISFGYSCDIDSCNSREYIGQYLSSPLSIGVKYYITLKTSLSISNTILVNCATDKLGVSFSVSKPFFAEPNPTLISNFAHVFSSIIITDTLGWTTISGSFIADSAYQYLVIGNFFDDVNTNTQIMDGNTYCNSYYFLDDICVSSDSVTCYNSTSISEFFNNNLYFNIYPNPSNNYVTIDLNNIITKTAKLYNLQGKLVCEFKLKSSASNTFNIQDLPNGIYLLQLNIDDTVYQQKLIINH